MSTYLVLQLCRYCIVADCSCHIGGPFKHQPNGWYGYQVDASVRYFGAISVKFSDVIAEFDATSDLFSIFGIRRLRTKFRVSMYNCTLFCPQAKKRCLLNNLFVILMLKCSSSVLHHMVWITLDLYIYEFLCVCVCVCVSVCLFVCVFSDAYVNIQLFIQRSTAS